MSFLTKIWSSNSLLEDKNIFEYWMNITKTCKLLQYLCGIKLCCIIYLRGKQIVADNDIVFHKIYIGGHFQ